MTKLTKTIVTSLAVAALSTAGAAYATPAQNKALVREAMTALFGHREMAAIARYWGVPYIQHNPQVANGADALAPLVKSLPPTFTYEAGLMVAEGDLVMAHGRYIGFGPKPLIVVDIFRVKGGKIVEHWDVMQEEVPTAMTKSGNPMFEPGA